MTAVIPLAGRHATGDVARRIRDLGAGVAVVFPNSLGSALDVTFKGIPVRVGRCGRGRSLLLSRTTAAWRRSERRARYHQATHYLDVAALLGPVRRTTDMPRFTLPGREAALERLGIAPAAAPWLALAPGAAYGPAKQWPVGNFRKLAESWAGAGRRVVIVGGPGDAAAGARIAEGLPHALSLCGKTTLAELMAVLSAARACVANDSGAMHLAAALGTPGVALFGSTNPEATGPLGARWIVLAEPTDCAPCFAHTCRRREQDYRCLTRISPERALAALASLAEA
ncbi:MAG: ADP-heptose--LPS heptosyltransferase 2 [Lentisphaerae bacterium ADurb.BinA184]|nr:MAG: ADP-heptose--LPS heptosyltransferase 2 [Lentisphaerae bacterium ADurb.BinA184]